VLNLVSSVLLKALVFPVKTLVIGISKIRKSQPLKFLKTLCAIAPLVTEQIVLKN
jgi:hypothetical protein